MDEVIKRIKHRRTTML